MHSRYVLNDRLVYVFDRMPAQDIWDERWDEEVIREFLSLDTRTSLGEYGDVFLPALDRRYPVLEAGCGPCRYLSALRTEGFDCIGIDNSKPLLAKVKKLREEFPLAGMDVEKLALADCSLGAYISLGVLEHFVDGMDIALKEVRRVLREGGLILASVPYFNPCRKNRAARGRYCSGEIPWESFYQYALTEEEFKKILNDNGFRAEKTHYLHTIKGLRDEFPLVKGAYKLYRRLVSGSIHHRLMARAIQPFLILLERAAQTEMVGRRYAHMVMVVGRKH